ncbi:MAG: peptide chain release factor N(5)-glutamine methyltransferase [Nitrospirae bacterium]|nr:peptide chain release factor N(5)-glutamine methyltransferase [Nitrospirota bacterium]
MGQGGKDIWTIFKSLSWAETYLKRFKIPNSKIDAEYLLSHILKCKRQELYLNPDRQLTDKEINTFKGFVQKRSKREPIQYIIGEEEFRGLVFKVTRDVLIPRPETELLLEEAVSVVKDKESRGKGHGSWTIVDLCTGSGCIAVSIAKEIEGCRVYATDISEKALAIAKENAKRHRVEDKIIFFQGSFLEPLKKLGLKGKIDIILSNPPYVSKKDMGKLQPEIKEYEPSLALYGGENGLDSYRTIIPDALTYLKKDGYLILEIGYGQAEGVKKLFAQHPAYGKIEIIKDLSGIERVAKARHELFKHKQP